MHKSFIRCRKYVQQICDFRNMRFGGITPTDIDATIEYHNKAWVIIEVKYKDTELPYGQRLALERLCDVIENTMPAIVIIASHDNSEGDIDLGNTIVTKLRRCRKWHKIDDGSTTHTITQRFLSWVDNASRTK